MQSRKETTGAPSCASLAVGISPAGQRAAPLPFLAVVLTASGRAVALQVWFILHAFRTHSAQGALCSSPAVDCSSLVAAHSPGAVRVGLSSGSSCGSPSATVGILHHSAPFHTDLDDLAGRRARSGGRQRAGHGPNRRRAVPPTPTGAARTARAQPSAALSTHALASSHPRPRINGAADCSALGATGAV